MKKRSTIAHRTKRSEDKNTIDSKKFIMCNQKWMQNLRFEKQKIWREYEPKNDSANYNEYKEEIITKAKQEI